MALPPKIKRREIKEDTGGDILLPYACVHTHMHTQAHTQISTGLQDIECGQKVWTGTSLGALRGPEAVDHNSIHFCSFLEYKLQVSLCDRAVPGSRLETVVNKIEYRSAVCLQNTLYL